MTYLIDLDGTLVYHGTNTPLPGAKEWLAARAAEGAEFVLVTRRGMEFRGHPIYSSCDLAIKELGIMFKAVIADCDSPRCLVNDEGCFAMAHPTNGEWNINDRP